MSTLRVDQITDEEGTGAPDFPNGIEVAGGALSGIADQAEAEAGTDNSKLMTPLRTAQAIAELSPAPSELTQTQVEDSTSTVFGTVSGQRLEQQTNAAFNITGAAPKFACRAWVNFNGTGTPSIRASGNVSSISRNGVGNYTVNLTTAMPDADYAVNVTNQQLAASGTPAILSSGQSFTGATAGAVSVVSLINNAYADSASISVSVFR